MKYRGIHTFLSMLVCAAVTAHGVSRVCGDHRASARNLAARRRSPSDVQASQLRYVLDRYHEVNHTACLDPNHALHLPEVRMAQYAELRNYNSSLSEQFNAWLQLFVPMTRRMVPSTYKLFILTLSVLWNTYVVRHGKVCAGVAQKVTATRLKRRRAETPSAPAR